MGYHLTKLWAKHINIWRMHPHSTPTPPPHICQFATGWICCAPCIWLRTSAAVHKIAITTATLLVTSLLVASPVLFLLSTAPSQLPRECNSKHDLDCTPIRAPAPECELPECQSVALNLLARMNWKLNACNEFRDFSYGSSAEASLKAVRSTQEDVDLQMLRECIFYISAYGPPFFFILYKLVCGVSVV